MMTRSQLAFIVASGFALVAFAKVSTVGRNVTVTGPDAVAVNGPEIRIDVQNGATATVTPPAADSVLVHLQDRLVVDAVSAESWKDKVGLWLDASKPETINYYCSASGSPVTFCGNNTIERWLDARQDDIHTWRLAQYRRAVSGTAYSTHPVYVPATETNSAYVSFNKNVAWGSRAWLFTAEEDAEAKAKREAATPVNEPQPATILPVKTVVMVFGSQNGGGPYAIGDIKRASTSTLPVPAEVGLCATDHSTWIDGAEVDPRTTGLSGGWQIISMDMLNTDVIKKIGSQVALNGSDWYGGQNFAEILFFTSNLTVLERRAVERYLAEKWKVDTYRAVSRATLAAGGSVRLYGKGEASVADGVSVSIGGAYEGRLTVPAGAEVTFVDTKLAPTNPAWIARAPDQTVLWYDPNRTDLSTYGDGKKNGDGTLKAREPGHILISLTNLAKPGWYPLVGGDRGAYWVDEALGFGPVRRWFDYRRSLNGYEGGTTRFSTYASDGNTFDARTGFMVLETTYGGTPFLDTSVYSGQTLYVKARGLEDPVFVPREGDSKAFVTNSPAYLDGFPIKSGEHSFNGRGELLSFAFTETVPVKCFGSYQQGYEYSGLRHGEVILTSETLSETDRKDTEAYLMKKWLGILPEGYGDPSETVIAGAGTVNLPGLVARPQFASDFTGTVNLKETVDFTIDATDLQNVKVVGALVASHGTVALAAGTVVRVSLLGGLALGKYTLVDASTLSGTIPQCRVTGAHGAFSLTAVGGKLILSVANPGMLVIFR